MARIERRRRHALSDHLRLDLYAQNEEALQRFAGLVLRPAVMMDAQAGLDLAAIGEVDPADGRIVADLVINVGEFPGIVFESAHGVYSITR